MMNSFYFYYFKVRDTWLYNGEFQLLLPLQNANLSKNFGNLTLLQIYKL